MNADRTCVATYLTIAKNLDRNKMQAEQSILDNSKKAIEMEWTAQNEGQLMAKEDLPLNTSRQEEKRKTTTIIEERSDRLHQKLKHGVFGVWECIHVMMMIMSIESVRLLVILADVLGIILKAVVCRCLLLGLNIGPFSLLDYLVLQSLLHSSVSFPQ